MVAFAAIAVLATSASGTTASGTDPLHDNGDAFDARGDVTAYSISYTASSVAVSVTTATFDNPATSPNWLVNPSVVAFGLDKTNDQNPEYIVVYFNDGNGNVIAGVVTNAENPVFLCDATPTFNAAAKSYSASFPASCIGNPAAISMAVIFDYFTNTAESFDITNFTSAVSVAPTTTTTAHTTTTTAPMASTTTTIHTTTTTTVHPTTTTTAAPTTTTTTVPIEQTQIHGSASNSNSCVSTVYLGPESAGNVLLDPASVAAGVTLAATAYPQPHRGDPIQMTGTAATLEIAGDVLQGGVSTSPPLITDGMQVPSVVTLVIAGSNTLEASHTYTVNSTATVHVIGGVAQPLSMTIPLPNTVWHPNDKTAAVTFSETSMKVSSSINILGGLTAVFQCQPAPSLQFLALSAGDPPTTVPPTTVPPTTVPPTTVPPTTVPRTTVPPTTVPRTTVPPTTVPPTTVPPTTAPPPPPAPTTVPPTTAPPNDLGTTTTVTAAVVTTTTISEASVTPTTVAGTTQPPPSGSLPRTGASWVLLLAVAGAAIDIGIALIGATRRRHRA